MPERMRPFARSTWPFDCGWATDAKSSRMPCVAQKRANAPLAKIRAVVGDDAMRHAIPSSDVGNERHGSRPVQLLDRLRFDPLGELVHGDKQMCQAAADCLERAHHVQSPDGKGPGEGNGLECRSRQVLLGTKNLASSAALDYFFSILQGSQPEEPMAESLGHEGS